MVFVFLYFWITKMRINELNFKHKPCTHNRCDASRSADLPSGHAGSITIVIFFLAELLGADLKPWEMFERKSESLGAWLSSLPVRTKCCRFSWTLAERKKKKSFIILQKGLWLRLAAFLRRFDWIYNFYQILRAMSEERWQRAWIGRIT